MHKFEPGKTYKNQRGEDVFIVALISGNPAFDSGDYVIGFNIVGGRARSASIWSIATGNRWNGSAGDSLVLPEHPGKTLFGRYCPSERTAMTGIVKYVPNPTSVRIALKGITKLSSQVDDLIDYIKKELV